MNDLEQISIDQDLTELTDPVLTKEQLAFRWKISIKTVERLARDRVHGVRFFRIRHQVRFRIRDVEEFEHRNLARQRPF